jgi:PAS domain S-box-containing protein
MRPTEMRKTGIDVVGDMPWGTHFCLFYETKADLLETTVSYCKAGLENDEFCLWVVAEPLAVEDAMGALQLSVPDFDRYFADHSIEIVAARDWYFPDGQFDLNRVINGWNQKLAHASAKGYAGVRVTGDTAWLEKKDWKDFCEYEESLNQACANQRLAVLCTYPLAACGAREILDVVRTHQFAVTKRRGIWDVIETAGHKQAKAEIKRLNEELEQRVVERTSQLTAVNTELTNEVLQRQRAEEALRRSEAYLAEAQKVSHTGSFGWSVSSGNIIWSDETFRILEFDPATKPTVELILQRTHPEDRSFVQEGLDQATRDRKVFDFEHRLLMPDASVKYVRVVGHPSTNDESGNFEFVGAVTDITNRKRAEQALRRSEGNLAQAQRLTQSGSWSWNLRTGARFWSQETFRIFGCDPEQVTPTWSDILDRVHPEDRPAIVEKAQMEATQKEDSEFDWRIVLPDGTIKHLHSIAHPLVDESGEITEIVGTLMDVSERKRVDEALLRSEAYLAEAQKLSHTGSWACDIATGEMIHSSTEHRHLFGLNPEREEIPSFDEFYQRIHPEDRDRTVEDLERAICAGTNVEAHFRVAPSEGMMRYMYGIGHPIAKPSGNVGEFVGAVMDVTERTLAQALRDGESRILEMIARDAPLREILEKLVLVVEGQFAGLLCSVLLLDEDGQHVRHGAAPSLPEAYTNAINGLPIGPKAGSCGTAMYRREPVVVTDILQDPLWEEYRVVAESFGLRACWSTPILAHAGNALGSFAMYYREPRSPGPAETRALEMATHLAGIAIEHKMTHEQLQRSEAYLAEAQRLSHTGSWAFDAQDAIYWSQENFRIWGFDPQQGLPDRESVLHRIHPADRDWVIEYIQKALREKTDYVVEFRIVLPEGTVKHIRGLGHPVFSASGELVEVVGTALDVTELRRSEAALQHAYEEIKTLKDQLYRENLALREEIDQASMFEEIVGTSAALQRLLSRVAKVAPTDSTVLITGETGTGKELIARAIHKRSGRAERAFVSVNCAATPSSLIASELFGHEKGAFTGAVQRRLGRFELAEGGTIFLDEVGELPAETQLALLRVLQEREFERVGGAQSISTDVRVIAATNRDLQTAIASSTFRMDLFYRLNVFPIEVPSLRERQEDIPMLVDYFIGRYAGKAGKKIRNIDRATLELFQSYAWPGNVRELQNVVERSVILCDRETFSVDESWLSRQSAPSPVSPQPLAESLLNQEKEMIERALVECGGRVAGPRGAATRLGIPQSTLATKIKTMGINKNRFKAS